MSDAVDRLGEFLNQPGLSAAVERISARKPDVIHDPVRPRPLRDGERIWTLRFGATHLEYELADSPSGRGLDTYTVGRVGPALGVLGWPRG